MSVVYDECHMAVYGIYRCSSTSGPEVVNLPVKRAVAWTHGRQVVHPLSFFLGGCFSGVSSVKDPPGRVKKA